MSNVFKKNMEGWEGGDPRFFIFCILCNVTFAARASNSKKNCVCFPYGVLSWIVLVEQIFLVKDEKIRNLLVLQILL